METTLIELTEQQRQELGASEPIWRVTNVRVSGDAASGVA
jgi:hypothetical protein